MKHIVYELDLSTFIVYFWGELSQFKFVFSAGTIFAVSDDESIYEVAYTGLSCA